MSMRELLERVKAASGANLALEEEIAAAFLPDGYPYPPPAYTASVDAALRLVEMALPGWEYSLTSVHADFRCEGEPRFFCDLTGPVTWVTDEGFPEPICDGHSGKAETPALAIVTALLTARTKNEDGA